MNHEEEQRDKIRHDAKFYSDLIRLSPEFAQKLASITGEDLEWFHQFAGGGVPDDDAGVLKATMLISVFASIASHVARPMKSPFVPIITCHFTGEPNQDLGIDAEEQLFLHKEG